MQLAARGLNPGLDDVFAECTAADMRTHPKWIATSIQRRLHEWSLVCA